MNRAVVWLGMLVGLCIYGCASSSKLPKDYFYRLPSLNKSISEAPLVGPQINISPFQSASIYASRAIVYAQHEHPYKLERYHYHFWEEIPKNLVRKHMLAYLQSNNTYRELSNQSQVKIGGRIDEFDHIRANNNAKVRVQITLSVASLVDQALYLKKTYQVEKTVPSMRIEDAVVTFSQALTDIYAQFLNDYQSVNIIN